MLLMLSTLGLVIVLDQASKSIVAARLPEGAVTRGAIGGVRLRHVVNRRRPWGSMSAMRLMAIGWSGLAGIGCLAATVLEMPAAHIALGLALGGATGNLIDGLFRRAVTDFIDLRVWPVFNVADVAIVIGALWMLLPILNLL